MTAEAFVTLTFYLAVFLISVALANLYQNSCRKGEVRGGFAEFLLRSAVVMPVALLIGLRGFDVGWDTFSMVHSYISDNYTLAYLLSSSHDPFSLIACKLLYVLLAGNATAVLFAFSFATLYILELAIIKWSDGVSLPLALFVYYLYFACTGMDQVKQMLALSILAYAAACLVNGQRRSFFLLTIVAGLFHFTAFFGFAFYLFYLKDSKHPFLVSLLIVLCVVGTVFSDLLFSLLGWFFGEGVYSDYFTGRFAQQAQNAEGGTGLRFVLDVIPCLFPVLFWKKLPVSTRALILVSLIAVMPLRMLGYQSDFLGRLSYEPALMIVFAYPLIYKGFSTRRGSAFALASCVLLLFYFYVAYSTGHGVVPYSLAF